MPQHRVTLVLLFTLAAFASGAMHLTHVGTTHDEATCSHTAGLASQDLPSRTPAPDDDSDRPHPLEQCRLCTALSALVAVQNPVPAVYTTDTRQPGIQRVEHRVCNENTSLSSRLTRGPPLAS